MAEKLDSKIDCAIAMVWAPSTREPLCEMFCVDHQSMTWTSKHYSGGVTFVDGGRLRCGETARLLAERGARSGIPRFARQSTVTFVVADLDPVKFESTRPTDWTVEQLERLPGADVSTHGPLARPG